MRVFCVVLLCVGAFACDEVAEDNTLGGSVGAVHDLSFQSTRVRLTDTELAVEYVDNGEVPVAVTVYLEQQAVNGPQTIDLLAAGDLIGSRMMSELPPLENGQLVIEAFSPSSGSTVSGYFDAQVSNGSRSYAVFGRFSAALEDLRSSTR